MSLERNTLLVTVLCAAGVVVATDRGAALYVYATEPPLDASVKRASNVHVFPQNPKSEGPRLATKSVLLVGNSHTYALPSLEPGRPLRPDPGATLVDELARRGPTGYSYYRLAYPNFLPFEMLLRIANLYANGQEPEVVFLGLTWRNIARDTAPRRQVREVLRDPKTRDLLLSATADQVRERVAAEIEDIERAKEEERVRSSADSLDLALHEALSGHSALVGSTRLRARLYRTLNLAIAGSVAPTREGYQYEVIENDLAFNSACLVALFDLLARKNAKVIVYEAPQRQDLGPLINPARQAAAMATLQREAVHRAFVWVDAKTVVRNELWGWAYDTPDRSHFTEPGHEALAEHLVTNSEGLLK